MTWSEHRKDASVNPIAEQEKNTFVGHDYQQTNCCKKTTIAWWTKPGQLILGKRHSGCADTGMVELIDRNHWWTHRQARAPRGSA